MPAITFYRHGMTASMTNRAGNPDPPKRGSVTGWSPAAARRNVAFLRSVDERLLTGVGYAATLTVRHCPPTPQAWSSALDQWQKRMRRAGMVRLHWVMEFQRRGVPHLHAAIWFADPPPTPSVISDAWLGVAADYGAGPKGQQVRPLDGVVGWFQYMAKHCSRSHRHYQRQRDAIPQAWQSSPRVWGHGGDWPIQDPAMAEITRPQFWRLRRLVRQSRIAEARLGLPLNRGQVAYLRRLLKCSHRPSSEVRPVSEWLPEHRQEGLLRAATY